MKVALNVPRSNWKIQSSIKREIEAMIKTKSASLHTELKADYYAGFAAAKQLASAMEVAGIYYGSMHVGLDFTNLFVELLL